MTYSCKSPVLRIRMPTTSILLSNRKTNIKTLCTLLRDRLLTTSRGQRVVNGRYNLCKNPFSNSRERKKKR